MMTPEDAKRQQVMDQAAAVLADSWPPMLFRMFSNLRKEGFTDSQAMCIVVAFLNALIMKPTSNDNQTP